MHRKCKKLRIVEQNIKSRKNDILLRPQFSRHPIPRRRKKKIKFSQVSSPIDVDATGDVLLGLAVAGPVGALMGLGSAIFHAFARMGTETVKTIRGTAEKARKQEKKKSAVG